MVLASACRGFPGSSPTLVDIDTALITLNNCLRLLSQQHRRQPDSSAITVLICYRAIDQIAGSEPVWATAKPHREHRRHTAVQPHREQLLPAMLVADAFATSFFSPAMASHTRSCQAPVA